MNSPSLRHRCIGFMGRAAAIGILLASLATAAAHADGLGGFLEYGYGNSTSKSSDNLGSSSKSNSSSFVQRYFLSLDRTIYPQLRFSGGGFFEKTKTSSETDGITSDSEATRFIPRGELTLSTPTYNAGLGYNRRTDSATTNGVSSPTNVVENMNARFSLKPEGLPTLNLFFTRTNFFDENRTSRDSTTDAYSLSSSYKPLKDLDLNYFGQHTTQTDRLNIQETTVTSQNARASYSRQFLKDRVFLGGTYNISQQASENARFLSLTIPGTVTTKTDTVSPAAIAVHTVLSATTPVAAGITIGEPNNTISANYTYFILKQNEPLEYIDTIMLTFDDDVSAIVNNFSYSIYTSNAAAVNPDANSTWNTVDPISKGFITVGPPSVPRNSYQIDIPITNQRYIIVVVQQSAPYSAISAYNKNVVVTGMSVFRKVTKNTTSTSLSHLFNLNGRVRLYEPGDVTYEFFYNLSKSKTDLFSATRYTLSNALRAQHRFSPRITGAARVSREDSSDQQQERVAYIYSASLQANPFPTLNHTLVYSGRNETAGRKTSSANSIYLSNVATPYRGVDLYLSTGYNTGTGETGQKTDSLTLSMGSSLAPNPKLTLNLNYAGSNIKQSGGSTARLSRTSHRGDMAISFTPVSAIYLYASYGIQMESGRETTTVQSYGGSWGILRDGTLQLNFSYSETINPTNSQKDRSMTPSLRWNIRPGSHLDVSYLISDSTTETQDSTFTSFSALLRIGF